MAYLDKSGLEYLWGKIKTKLANKVDVVEGKGLSTNDYTTTEQTKLAGIEEGANKITVDTTLNSTSTNPVENKAINTALSKKVDKVTGKGLSKNDFTDVYKNKLDAITNFDGSYNSLTDKPVIDDTVTETSDNAVKSSGIYDYVNSSIGTNTAYFRGTFNSVAELNAYSGEKTLNDYAFVKSTDTAGNTLYSRYKYDDSAWVFEYSLNNSSFTANQWETINSGLTSADKITVDSVINSTSTNPVQNKIINSALGNKINNTDFITNSEIDTIVNS